jgi:hypothetical protein
MMRSVATFKVMRHLPATGSGNGVILFRRHTFPGLFFLGILLFGIGLVLLFSRMALAGSISDTSPDAFSVLARAMRAKRHQTYTAHQEILFASGPPGAQWTRVVADVARDGRRSRIIYRFPPSVADLIVADTGKVVWQSQPSCHLFLVRKSPSDGGEAELSLLHRNYRCRLKERMRMDSFLCDRVEVVPRYTPGPWRICWIDRIHRTILRTEEYDSASRRQYLSTLTAIRFVSSLPSPLFSPKPPLGTTVQTAPSASGMPFARAWAASGGIGRSPCWLPRGWALLYCTPVLRPGGGQVLRLRFGDGLKNMSVFQEALSPGLPPLPIQQKMLREQLGSYGQQAWVMEGGGIRVTAVGDSTLPAETGREMLRSLLPETEETLSHALARDFGPRAAKRGAALRRQGWDYEQIAARLLQRRSPDHYQEKARNWVVSIVTARKTRQ